MVFVADGESVECDVVYWSDYAGGDSGQQCDCSGGLHEPIAAARAGVVCCGATGVRDAVEAGIDDDADDSIWVGADGF